MVLTTALLAGVPVAAYAQPAPEPEAFTIIVAGTAPQLFIAEGALDGTGTAVPVSSAGENGGTDRVQFPGGTFMLTLANNPGGTGTGNPVTCVDTFSGTGVSTISGGTGRFAGITGTGTFTFNLTFIADRTPQGGCSQQGTVLDLVRDRGTLTLPFTSGRRGSRLHER